MLFRLAFVVFIYLEMLAGVVKGRCGPHSTLANSDWVACFPKVNGDCPVGINLKKVPGEVPRRVSYCGFFNPNEVCCQFSPDLRTELIGLPCLDEPCKDKGKERKMKIAAKIIKSVQKRMSRNLH